MQWFPIVTLLVISWVLMDHVDALEEQAEAMEARVEHMSEEVLSANLQLLALWHHIQSEDEE